MAEIKTNPIVVERCTERLFGWKKMGEQQLRALMIAYLPAEFAKEDVYFRQKPLLGAVKANAGGYAYLPVFGRYMEDRFTFEEIERIGLFVNSLSLTPAELATCVSFAKFNSSSEVCNALAISNQTFKNHFYSIFDKVELVFGKRVSSLGLIRLVLEKGALPKKCIPDLELWEKRACLINSLSQRQREIVQLVLMGCLNKEIAFLLNIEKETVKNHLTAAYRKLEIDTGGSGERRPGRPHLAPLVLMLNSV